MAPLLAMLAVAPPASAATPAPAVTPTAADTRATAMAGTPTASTGAPTSTRSAPTPTPARWTPRPTASPEPAPSADPTASELPAGAGDADGPAHGLPDARPTSPPVAPVRAFRTPEREAAPAFVAPRSELPEDADDPALDDAAPDAMPSPDQPYVATVTFRAAAATELDGFELLVIYPRAAGDFVGDRNGVECRKSGDGTLFADDLEDGTLRVLVASRAALAFPLDVVCRFTVAPNAVLTSRLIAVNVVDVTIGGTHGEPSALTVAVTAR